MFRSHKIKCYFDQRITYFLKPFYKSVSKIIKELTLSSSIEKGMNLEINPDDDFDEPKSPVQRKKRKLEDYFPSYKNESSRMLISRIVALADFPIQSLLLRRI
jgi:hypothetical protein